jgi:hypothetical protein
MLLIGPSILAENVADCGDPPGGRITCEDTQAAFCKVMQGRVYGYCRTPPVDLKGPDLHAWVLTQATGEKVSAKASVDLKYSKPLEMGRWEAKGEVVTFRLPKARSGPPRR